MYYLHLYVSPFGEDRAPWGHDDANVPKLHHNDDPDVNPFFSPTFTKTKRQDGEDAMKSITNLYDLAKLFSNC